MAYLLICGDQLFSTTQLKRGFGGADQIEIVMVEDSTLCERRAYHQLKLTFVITAMRRYAESLRAQGYKIHYWTLDQEYSLARALDSLPAKQDRVLLSYEVHNSGQKHWISHACRHANLEWQTKASPMFLTDQQAFRSLAGTRQPLQMGRFYKAQRQRLQVLIDVDGAPLGGQWSFDEQNRQKLPKNHPLPELPQLRPEAQGQAVAKLIAKRYPDNIGNATQLWLPTDRAGALRWLQRFLKERLIGFGTYEDAISQRSWSLFHSALSPLLNVGLLTAQEVLAKTLKFADEHEVPINDLEGFVRQLIGWREFVRGVYVEHGQAMRTANTRNQQHVMLPSWHRGELGIPPFDDAINTLQRTGWNHHIERLMIIVNLMNLAQIAPKQVYEFFMSYYLDAYDWVMVPNVFGMGLNSDDNTFATKPYICGSNYWLKMSDYRKGDWCQVVDGLYWQFVSRHREQLSSNPRTAMMPRNLDRLKGERRQAIFSAADQFMQTHTRREK